MIASLLPLSHMPIYVCIHQTLGQIRAEEEVIDSNARIASESVSEVVPEDEDLFVRVDGTKGISRSPGQQPRIAFLSFRDGSYVSSEEPREPTTRAYSFDAAARVRQKLLVAAGYGS